MPKYGQFATPFGPMAASLDEAGRLTRLVFLDGWAGGGKREEGELRDDAAFAQIAGQIEQFFKGERRQFELPLAPLGSAFQQQVWAVLQQIPYGQTCSYGQLAQALQKPGAARAVGRANGSNPIALIIPCHRVIGANGSLTGYAGGLALKQRLLAFEQGQHPYQLSAH